MEQVTEKLVEDRQATRRFMSVRDPYPHHYHHRGKIQNGLTVQVYDADAVVMET